MAGGRALSVWERTRLFGVLRREPGAALKRPGCPLGVSPIPHHLTTSWPCVCRIMLPRHNTPGSRAFIAPLLLMSETGSA